MIAQACGGLDWIGIAIMHLLHQAAARPIGGRVIAGLFGVSAMIAVAGDGRVNQAIVGGREVFIRVNGVDSPWHADDLSAAARAAPDVILVPKVSSPDTLELIGRRLLDMGTDRKTRVWAMIETPLAIFNILSIAAEARDSETRLSGFVMGTNDLAKDTRARLVPGRAPMLPWLSMCVAAARIHGIDILDGVYNDIGNADGFINECRQGVDLGFDGKTLIHPSQIEPCNTAFSPSPAEVEWARKMIEAFDLPENRGKGVVSIDGRMVERLHADMARRTVAIAEAIQRSS